MATSNKEYGAFYGSSHPASPLSRTEPANMFKPSSGLSREDNFYGGLGNSMDSRKFSGRPQAFGDSRHGEPPLRPSANRSALTPSSRSRQLSSRALPHTSGRADAPVVPKPSDSQALKHAGSSLKASNPEALTTWPQRGVVPNGTTRNLGNTNNKTGHRQPDTRPTTSASLASQYPPSMTGTLNGTGLPHMDKPKELFGVKSLGGVAPGFVKENQDDAFVMKSSGNEWFAGVMDGHGMEGKKVSGFVKEKLVSEQIERQIASAEPKDAINFAFNVASSELKRSGIDCRESGSTTVTCMRKGDELYVGNVGDSRCVLARQTEDGGYRAVPLSRDHKPKRRDEMERILKCNGHVEPTRAFGGRFVGPPRVWAVKQQIGGLAVSRAMGDTNLNSVGVIAQPEIMKETITKDDKLVILASDGVWEHMTNQDAVNIARAHANDPKKASEAIVNRARDMWGKERMGYRDDITAVVVRL